MSSGWPPIDLAASRSCQLVLLDPIARALPDDVDKTPYTKSVILPGTATVQIGDETVTIPEGTTVYVMHESMTYKLIDFRYAEPSVTETEDADVEDWTVKADHPHTNPRDGRTECDVCGKWIFPATHSCKGVPVTEAARKRWFERNGGK